MDSRKQAVSIRMSAADIRSVKRLAERLGVRDSDVIRFAVKVMLGRLAPLHDLGVIVVRWYGGVKLGTGGLSRAYRDTAAETLRLARPLERYVYMRFRVLVPFEALNQVYRLIDPPNVLLAEERFGEQNEFVFDVRMSAGESFAARLRELRLATLP